MKSASKFLVAILFLEFIYIIFFLLNYDNAWMHWETFVTHEWSLSNGKHWQWEDFARSLNVEVFELEAHRIARPLCDLFELANAKFRAWCWNFITPHPSFSFLWPLLLAVLPVFFFKFLRNMGCRTHIALAGVILYLASPGFLSPIVMLFHPSKGFINFLGVMSLFFGSQIYRRSAHLPWGSSVKDVTGFWPYFIAFLSAMFVSFFIDETGLFLMVIAAVILYPVIFRFKQWPMLVGIGLLLPAGYWFVVKWFLPKLHFWVRGKVVELTSYYSYPTIADFKWENLKTNIVWLLSDHPRIQVDFAELSNNFALLALQCVYTVVMIGVFVFFVRALFKGKQTPRYIIVGALTVILFMLFHTFQLAKFNPYAWGVWWYGSLYSLLFFIFFTFVLQYIDNSKGNGFFQKCFVWIVLVCAVHGSVFFLYRSDVFLERLPRHHGYAIHDVFNGKIGQYYKTFNFIESVKRNDCKHLYTSMRWAYAKGKKVDVPQSKIDHCQTVTADDISFPNEVRYLDFEL